MLTQKKWLTKSANQNFALAQFLLTRRYQKDPLTSLNLLKKAASQNVVIAIRDLKFYYSVKEPNLYKVLKYLNQAYKLKDVNSTWELGDYQYAITQDIDEALTWYEKAAELKIDLLKTIKVGKMYEEGVIKVDYFNQKGYSVTKKINIKKNKEKALHYYKKHLI